jgi:hypothetical protein
MKHLVPILACFLAVPVAAEKVDVKGRRTPIDLSNTQLVEQACKPSVCIDNVYYDPKHQYLVFQARGTYYHRCEVPAEVVQEWVESNNLKRYYDRYIKPDYDCAGKPLPY